MTKYQPGTYAPTTAGRDEPSSVQEKASDVARTGAQSGARVGQTAAHEAKQVAQETSRQARDLLAEARGQMQQQAEGQQRSLAQKLRELSEELSRMTSGTEQKGMATELVSQAQGRISDVAQWLEHRQPGDVLQELRSFARRHPGSFLVGAAAAGAVAGRLTRGVQAAASQEAGRRTTPTVSSQAPTGAPYEPPMATPYEPPVATPYGDVGRAAP